MYSKVLIWTSGLALCLSGSGCGKKSTSSSSTAAETSVTLTGQLALSGGESTLRLTSTTTVDDLSMYCVSFTLPPVAGTGEFDAEGKFAVTLDTTGVSVGCFILDPDEAILGTLVFKDPAKKDLKGGSKSSDRLAFEGGESDLGSIVLNLDTGTAEVDISKIVLKTKSVEAVASEGELYNFTGSYKFAQSDLTTLPSGYSKLCSEPAPGSDGDRDCKGPRDGMPIYLKVISGVSTTDASAKVHAASLWASKTVDDLCGNKLGFTYAQAKEKGVDFTNSGVTEGAFNWDPSLTDGWKDQTNARAQHALMKMENVDSFKGYPGTKQYFKRYRTWNCPANSPCTESEPITASGFSFFANSKESGCRDAAGKPIQLSDWDNMQCENTQLTGDSAGLNKSICKKTVDNAVITCTNIQGTFNADGSSLANAMTRFPEDFVVYANGAFCDKNANNVFDGGSEWPTYDPATQSQTCSTGTLKQGDLCKDIVTTDSAGKLAQLRCYADYMHKSEGGGGGGGDNVTACMREINTNWSAKTPEEFLLNSDGPSRAKGQFVFELFDYDSATSGSLRGEDTYFNGIQVGNNWTDCEVREVFSFSMKKVDDAGNLYGEMVSSETNVSPKPVCVAEYGQGKTTKYVFKMLKQ